MFHDPWIAAFVALFIWWFSTGAILFVVRWADRIGRGKTATLAAVPMLLAGLYGFWATADQLTTGSVYHAFLAALAIWGWIELAFLTGVITGPNLHVLPVQVPAWERFIRAWGTIAYHEMLLVTVVLGMGIYAAQAENPFGFWTFALLFVARISAKLNLFLGVPKINTEFLPSALAHLPSHFRTARLNWLFPVSVTLLTAATACWLERIVTAQSLADQIGFALLAAMTALALLEHWFMVLPLPDEKLWRWMLPAPNHTTKKTTTEDAHGL
ncbi:putative photosynthetic complex assembly protein PuhE [Cognatishimia sp. F0-27]|uniref:putative photosynthetic complex assembly protein PuhE n=1 Tax=Cognatishimia sp. F0-27 TaxID=2816855 RepID=UPI001D0C3ED7|nr:putative photosynthetic complex assembly protein PuhE [Cognatishimia sp. F0-27]MCC1492400.1 DUF3623 domain-containing protein [Cognatishimia sp. F0-27]